jgi:DNA-binding NarL/FixJ family response regulator
MDKIIVIADDHPIFRSGLKALLQNDMPDHKIIEVDDGLAALECILTLNPALAILDLEMPGLGGIQVCEKVPFGHPTKMIILTMYDLDGMVAQAKRNGAAAYVLKEHSGAELTKVIHAVLDGKGFVFVGHQETQNKETKHLEDFELLEKLNSLTTSEWNTLNLVAQNKTSKEIGEMLFVSTKSVENYRSRVCKKLELDAKNNSLLTWALAHQEIIQKYKKLI